MKQLKLINQVLLVVIGLALFSCVEPFTPDLGDSDYDELLVVEGHLTNKPGPFRVKLTYSIPLDTVRLAEPVYGAYVHIYDDKGGDYKLFYTTDGWYETKSHNLSAQEGMNYSLYFETSDGKQYESTPVAMEPAPEIKSVHWEEFEKTNFEKLEPTNEKWLNILVDSKGEHAEKSYLKWDYEETWQIDVPYFVEIIDLEGIPYYDYINPEEPFETCWATEKSSAITLGTSEGLEENEIINIPVKSIGPNDTRLHIEYSILVKQYSLSKTFFEYWSKLEEVNENSGSMFDKAPSSIYGNITCCNDDSPALGYFMVSDLKEERIFIKPEHHTLYTNSGFEGCNYADIKYDDRYFYVGTIMGTTSRLYQTTFECVDCGAMGTKEKPSFWK